MIKMTALLAAFALTSFFGVDASAQDGKRKGKKDAILKKFDKDGDGKLSAQERAAAKEFKDKRRAEDGRDGKRRGKVLRKFDKDGDGKLNRAERHDLRKFRDNRREKGRRNRSG